MSDNLHIVTGSSSKKSGDNKWLIFAIPIIIMISIFFTVLITSGKLTENQKSASRNISQNKVTQAPTGVNTFASSVDFQQQEPVEEGLNTFVMVGTFSKVEPVGNLIYLMGKTGKPYVFRIDGNLLRDEQTWLNVYIVPDIKSLNDGRVPDYGGAAPLNDTGYFSESIKVNIDDIESMKDLSEIAIRWNDSRSVAEIVEKYVKDPVVPLNEFFPNGVVVAKFK